MSLEREQINSPEMHGADITIRFQHEIPYALRVPVWNLGHVSDYHELFFYREEEKSAHINNFPRVLRLSPLEEARILLWDETARSGNEWSAYIDHTGAYHDVLEGEGADSSRENILEELNRLGAMFPNRKILGCVHTHPKDYRPASIVQDIANSIAQLSAEQTGFDPFYALKFITGNESGEPWTIVLITPGDLPRTNKSNPEIYVAMAGIMQDKVMAEGFSEPEAFSLATRTLAALHDVVLYKGKTFRHLTRWTLNRREKHFMKRLLWEE